MVGLEPRIDNRAVLMPALSQARNPLAPIAARKPAERGRSPNHDASTPIGAFLTLSRQTALNAAPVRRQAILNLQRTIGNRETGRLLRKLARTSPTPRPNPAQPKLTVGQPDDAYEREADAAASRIETGQTVERISRLPAGGLKQSTRRQPEGDEEKAQTEPVQRKCAACEDGDRVQRQAEDDNEESVQMQTAGLELALDTDRAASAMAQAGGGSPLEPAMQMKMERGFGADFSGVRVHTGGAAMEASDAISARAFTHGSDIYMGPGASPTDHRLMAHELTHTLQQGTGVQSANRQSGAITVWKKPLTAEERAVDLTSDAFRDDTRLQNAFDNSPVLGFGARGEAVKKIQQALVDLGFPMPVSTKDGTEEPDGVFGAETLRTVKAFQFMQGVARDGIVGRQTLGELDGRMTGRHPPGSPPPFTVPPNSRVTVSAIDLSPQRFEKCADGFGRFHWEIAWQTNARNGYIVQEMESSQQGVFCDGSPDPGVAVSAPLFWEAWRIQQDGKVHPPPGSDTWQVPVHPFHRGTWRLTGKAFFVEQLDPQAGFQVGNMAAAQAGSLYATASKPNNLGPVLLTRQIAGLWECCDDRNVHEPHEGSSAPPFGADVENDPTSTIASLRSTLSNLMQGNGPKDGTPERKPGGSGLDATCPPGYTQCDFIDQRISVPGQFGLYELYRRGGSDCANAVAMLSAVRSSMLQGVYKADEQKPAMMAVRNGTTWWELVPPGQGAVVFDAEAPPMAVFRKNLASDRRAVATALNRAWNASELGKRSIAAVPPSLEACPSRPPPPSPSTPEPECPPGTIPDPSGDICLIPLPGQVDTECTDAEMAQQFKKQKEFCANVKSGLDMACQLGVSVCDIGKEVGKLACDVYERIFGKPPPQTKPPECSESRATFYEKCIVSTVVGESGSLPCYPGTSSDIKKKYRRWPGQVK